MDWFLGHPLADGGWNCEWVNGASKSSFHSTLNTLKGLLDYERVTGDRARVGDARRNGEEYLLARGLYRRLTTGEPVAPWALRLAYPFRWSTACSTPPTTSAPRRSTTAPRPTSA